MNVVKSRLLPVALREQRRIHYLSAALLVQFDEFYANEQELYHRSVSLRNCVDWLVSPISRKEVVRHSTVHLYGRAVDLSIARPVNHKLRWRLKIVSEAKKV